MPKEIDKKVELAKLNSISNVLQKHLDYKAKQQNRKGVLKAIKRGALGAVAITSLIIGGPYAYNKLQYVSNINNGNYKSQPQITQAAQMFGADMRITNYLSNYVQSPRLVHNNGAPIYVYINDNFGQKDIDLIKKSLNYYEDVFKNINPDYKFEVVSYNKYKQAKGKHDTTIIYTLEDIDASGRYISRPAVFNFNYVVGATIKLDSNSGIQEKDRYYTLVHEMAHAFGLGDVYYTGDHKNVDIMHSDTVMSQSQVATDISELFPNDYKVLNALYNESYLKNGKVDNEKVQEIVERIEKYEQDFFVKAEKVLKDYNHTNKFESLDMEEVKTLTFTKNTLSISPKYQVYAKQTITFDDNMYTFRALNKNNEIIEEVKGRYVVAGDTIFLPSLELKKALIFGRSDEYGKTKSEIYMLALTKTNHGYSLSNFNSLSFVPINTSEKTTELINNQEINLGQEKTPSETVLMETDQYKVTIPDYILER